MFIYKALENLHDNFFFFVTLTGDAIKENVEYDVQASMTIN